VVWLMRSAGAQHINGYEVAIIPPLAGSPCRKPSDIKIIIQTVDRWQKLQLAVHAEVFVWER